MNPFRRKAVDLITIALNLLTQGVNPGLDDRPRLVDRGQVSDDAWRQMDEVADSFGVPRQWIVCPHCGAQSWRLPPHGFDPCPIVKAVAESTGMKFDAERTSAVRMGVHMEEMTRALRMMVDEEDDE